MLATPSPAMTLNELTDILEENPTVDDYDIKDDGVRFWVGTRAYKEAKQIVIDDIEGLDGVELEFEKIENNWEWYFASLTQ